MADTNTTRQYHNIGIRANNMFLSEETDERSDTTGIRFRSPLSIMKSVNSFLFSGEYEHTIERDVGLLFGSVVYGQTAKAEDTFRNLIAGLFEYGTPEVVQFEENENYAFSATKMRDLYVKETLIEIAYNYLQDVEKIVNPNRNLIHDLVYGEYNPNLRYFIMINDQEYEHFKDTLDNLMLKKMAMKNQEALIVVEDPSLYQRAISKLNTMIAKSKNKGH